MMNTLHKYVVVEPTFFFYFFGSEIGYFAVSNMYLQKACRNDTSAEPDLSTPCDDDQRGSDYIATVYNNFTLPGMFLSLVFTVFASSYSDMVRKRRIFIAAALVGHLLKMLVSMAQTIFWSWSPLTGIVLSCIAEYSLGGWLGLFNFTYAYLFDRISIENRLTRVTLLSVVQSVGMLLGKTCAGFLLRKYGFLISFVISFVLYSLALVWTCFFVQKDTTATEEQRTRIRFKDVFGPKRTWDMFVLIALPKQKPKKQIAAIWLLLLIDLIVYFAFFGEFAVYYLYFRNRFHWDEEKYSVFAGYRNISSAFGGILCSLVMSSCLRIHDSVVGAFAAFWDTFAAVGFYYAHKECQLYLVCLFDIFHGLALSTCFSQMSKFFTEREFGRLHSMKMIFLTIGTCGVPVYSILYKNTTETHPNAFFLLSTFISGLICVLYIITFFLSREIRISDQMCEAPSTE